jgi:chromate transporter
MAASDLPSSDALAATVPARDIGPGELFVAFSQLALSGFGGVLPFAYRALVEKRQWLEAREFASLLAIAQVMPGPTICNLSVMIGQRYAGFAGASAALGGMVLGPSCIVVALGIAWQHYGDLTAVREALHGMSSVAIGLILATAVKMGISLFKPDAEPVVVRPVPASEASSASVVVAKPPSYWTIERSVQIVLCTLGFVGVGLLRWPLAAVVAGLAPIAIGLSWFIDRRHRDP